MRLMRLLAVVVVLLAASPLVLVGQNESPPAAREEYVPLDQLPPGAELPAAPMVIAAYMFVWAAFLVYVLSLVGRIRKVESDLRALEHTRPPSRP